VRRTLRQEIDANVRKSAFLVVLLVLLLAAIGGVFTEVYLEGGWPYGSAGAGLLGIVCGAVAWTRGPGIVLRIAGARPAEGRELQVAQNVTEEMAIAAGIPTPHLYVLDDPSPNAFATGNSPRQGIVCVTTGLLELMDRDELQGVVAHEVAHIRNNDVRLLTTVALVAGLIPMLCDVFWRMLRVSGGGRSRSKDGCQLALVLLVVAVALAVLAPLFSKLLELAVSRRREFLADATAAELTRNPEGLASALEKLSRPAQRLRDPNRAIEHMFIVNPLRPFQDEGWSWFSTHPPTLQRLRALRSLAGWRPKAAGDFSDMPETLVD
jgi:heat shock protein HtpX